MLNCTTLVVFGLFITVGGLVCVTSAFIFISDPQTKNLVAGEIAGVIMGLLAVWLFSLASRLLLNRQQPGGGLFSPVLLRLLAIYFFAMPTFMIITGRNASWHIGWYILAALSYLGSFNFWRLAANRSAKSRNREIKLDE